MIKLDLEPKAFPPRASVIARETSDLFTAGYDSPRRGIIIADGDDSYIAVRYELANDGATELASAVESFVDCECAAEWIDGEEAQKEAHIKRAYQKNNASVDAWPLKAYSEKSGNPYADCIAAGVDAAIAVSNAWQSGDLAGAVRALNAWAESANNLIDE